MAMTITDDRMTSDTPHRAARNPEHQGVWGVSWLLGRTLTRNQAITAMTLAETVATGDLTSERTWLFIDGWAEELGLAGATAVGYISVPLPIQPHLLTGVNAPSPRYRLTLIWAARRLRQGAVTLLDAYLRVPVPVRGGRYERARSEPRR